MRKQTSLHLVLFIILLAGISGAADTELTQHNSCEAVVHQFNQSLSSKIDETELVTILKRLNETNNKRLPSQFVTKRQAQKLGWKSGQDLRLSKALAGKSIGGDLFYNREGKLPNGGRVWREADLDYKGGRRGAKRIIYSDDGLRSVTVDHYNTFKAVPPCD